MIHEIRPEFPDSDKTVILEFVQDAGLGNTLFEFAAGYSIARTLNLPFKWMWRPSRLREFGLGAFGIGENPYKEYPMLMLREGQGNRVLYEKAIQRIRDSKEKSCGISCPFQEESCFIDHADEIREIFKLEPIRMRCPSAFTPVGVQVRRGDYKGHPRLDVTTPAYFLNAMEWMRGKVERPIFFVVSDDPSYCREIFHKFSDVHVMPPQSPIDGLRTLASCDSHIISNSTFGWWGAWLGEKGPVVAPEHWHHMPGSYGDWNIVPDRWVKLPIGQEVKRAPEIVIRPRSVAPLPAPTLERAIVIPWHATEEKWHELRMCLRSIEKHFEDKKCPIFVFGTRRPNFIKENGRVQYRGAFTYSEALTGGIQVANKVAWWNDDCVLLKPTTWADIETPYHLGPVTEDLLKQFTDASNPWRAGFRLVLDRLTKLGITEHLIYSTHLPYVWEREKALQVFEKFGVWEKMPFELAAFHLFPEGSKRLNGERTDEPTNKEAKFLNYADRHLTERFKAEVLRLFPDFAEWEVNFPF